MQGAFRRFSDSFLVAFGIGPKGRRSILGVRVSLSETEAYRRDFLRSLHARGLQGSSWSPATPAPVSGLSAFGAGAREGVAVGLARLEAMDLKARFELRELAEARVVRTGEYRD